MLLTANVLRVYQNGGVPMADIIDQISGATHFGCGFLGTGSGTDMDDENALPTPGAIVVYAGYGGTSQQQFILGTLRQTSAGSTVTPDPAIESGKDYPIKPAHTLDRIIRKAGAAFLVTHDGRIVLDTTEAAMDIHAQLAGGATLRISQNGDEPTERVLMAGPTRDTLDSYVERMNLLLSELSSAVTGLLTMATATGSGSPVQAAMAKLALELTTISTTLAAQTPLTITGDELVADAILISDHPASVPGLGPEG